MSDDFSAVVKHWRAVETDDGFSYPGSEEKHSLCAAFSEAFGLRRLGIHHERLPLGRRTSWPHAEADEEEFVFVLEGEPDVWLDGVLRRLSPGDGVGFPAGTGLDRRIMKGYKQFARAIRRRRATSARSPARWGCSGRRGRG